jgi:hypothetical protein
VQAEIANATCEQIARGGLLAALYPLRGEAQLDCEYARAREMVREANIVTLATCLRAARWLMDAQHTGEAMAVLEGCRLLSDANVKAAIEAFRRPDEAKTLRTIEQLQARWAEWADDDGCQLKDRLKATELLGKSLGAFVERREVKHEGVSVVGVVFPSVEAARRVAKGESE